MNNVLINVMDAQNTLFEAISQSNMAMKQSGLYDSPSAFQSTLNQEIKNTNSANDETGVASKNSNTVTDNSENKSRAVKEKQSEKTKEEKISRKEQKSAKSDERKKGKASSEKEEKNTVDDDAAEEAVSTVNDETVSPEDVEVVAEELPVEDVEVLEDSEDDVLPEAVAVLPVVTEVPVITEEEIAAYWNAEADTAEEVASAETEDYSDVENSTDVKPVGQNTLSPLMEEEKTVKADRSHAAHRNVQTQQIQQTQAETSSQDAAAQSADELLSSASGKEDVFINRQDSKLTGNAASLNTGSDFKLNSLKVEDLRTDNSRTENPQEVLKNLLGRARTVSPKVTTNTSNSGTSNPGNQENAYSLKSEIQNFLAMSTKDPGVSFSGASKLAQGGFNGALDAVRSNGQAVSNAAKADAVNAASQTQDVSPARSFTASTAAQHTTYSGGTSANAALVGELISRMQDMIKGSNLDKGSKLSMDFESSTFGQVNLSVQQKAGALAVNIQLSSDSSKDQLMQQRDELANQLRMMGYKDVSLDISAGKDNQDNARSKNKNTNKGNDDIQNVKLAGDDRADRASVAEMYS